MADGIKDAFVEQKDGSQSYRLLLILVVDFLLLLSAAPFLYFPTLFPSYTLFVGFCLIGCSWIWRRWQTRSWISFSPADLPLLVFLVVLLPLSIWVAPPTLQSQYSIPRTYILLWNLSLFWSVIAYSSQYVSAGKLLVGGYALATLGLAVLAPLGIAWLYKFPGLGGLLGRIPSPLQNLFIGAESGFHPNQVAGTLLYALPLFLALSVDGLRIKNLSRQDRLYLWLFSITAVTGTIVLFLTQSRAALLGMVIGVCVMALAPRRWGRRILLGLLLLTLIALPFIPPSAVDLLGDTPAEVIGGTNTLGFRQDVWTQALRGIYDFPITGMGFGTFREVIWLLYPTNIPPTYNLGHAHNFFLQTALDFGVPGLIIVLALYILAAVQLSVIWRSVAEMTGRFWRSLAVGMLGSLVAHVVYSQLDAVAMGAKTNFMFWYLFALIFGFANYFYRHRPAQSSPADVG